MYQFCVHTTFFVPSGLMNTVEPAGKKGMFHGDHLNLILSSLRADAIRRYGFIDGRCFHSCCLSIV